MASRTVLGACFLVFVWLCYYLLRPTPLDQAPCIHWSAKYSSLWIRWKRYQDQDTLAVHEAHLRHGPVVRLGPKEMSIVDAATGIKPIYEGRLPKTDWFQIIVSYGSEPMFAMKDNESHRRRRKMVTKPYQNSYIKANRDWQEQQAVLARDFHSSLEKLSGNTGEVAICDMFFAWALATVSTYIFGHAAGVNVLDDLPKARQKRQDYYKERNLAFWVASVPYPINKLLLNLRYSTEISFIEELRIQADRHAAEPQEKSKGTNSTPYDYMKNEFSSPTGPDSKVEQPSPKAQAALSSEMQDHVIAGLDTSVIVLTICAWLLSLDSNRTWQDKCRAEARGCRESDGTLNTDETPIIDAVIKETLRVYPPVSGMQPRITDKPTAVGPGAHQIVLPPGITVHAQTWTLHRNNEVFPKPEEWRPERWIECSPEKRKEMDAWSWAFGSGPRRCLGEQLALNSLKTALVVLYGGFETRLTENTEFSIEVGNMLIPSTLQLRVDKAEAQ
ncbi:uncharacterized protein LTR77_002487 [Saxophila tyrrhenica]|uniref:Cytochrome P450 n=1 Tax=Saxophila tyrrhenica TaxID=1690608 RepID=A0AAV9PNG5_9PEZI|nr:hypothetical protein LTR77_002487 [Saxophila tyrrhenica]